MAFDANDPRPVYLQLAALLRDEIAGGTYKPGQQLPTQIVLAGRYDVAQMTVQRALDQLAAEKLIASRKGSGTYVRHQALRKVGVRASIGHAFDEPHVHIDFAGHTGRTLHSVIIPILNKIARGQLQPESVKIRMLLPDFSKPLAFPRSLDNPYSETVVRDRTHRDVHRYVTDITTTAHAAQEKNPNLDVSVNVRVYPNSPTNKLFIINHTEMFIGFYSVRETINSIDGRILTGYELDSDDITLFYHSTTDKLSTNQTYIDEAQRWFTETWNTATEST